MKAVSWLSPWCTSTWWHLIQVHEHVRVKIILFTCYHSFRNFRHFIPDTCKDKHKQKPGIWIWEHEPHLRVLHCAVARSSGAPFTTLLLLLPLLNIILEPVCWIGHVERSVLNHRFHMLVVNGGRSNSQAQRTQRLWCSEENSLCRKSLPPTLASSLSRGTFFVFLTARSIVCGRYHYSISLIFLMNFISNCCNLDQTRCLHCFESVMHGYYIYITLFSPYLVPLQLFLCPPIFFRNSCPLLYYCYIYGALSPFNGAHMSICLWLHIWD